MKTVISKDGTRLATYCSGQGLPLVLVQGTGAARPEAWPAFPALAEQFQITTFDRRGRGASGDSQDYDVAREFEDVAAVVDVVAGESGRPVNLLGHSFGGLLALEAALRTNNIAKLALYEPALLDEHSPHVDDGFVEQLQALLRAADLEGLLRAHYRKAGITEEAIAQLKASSSWQERLGSAHTIPRELRAIDNYTFRAQRFQDLTMPTLLLMGSESPEFEKAGAKAIHAALPDSRVAILQDQDHVAMYTAPALFVRQVQAFLCGS